MLSAHINTDLSALVGVGLKSAAMWWLMMDFTF